MHTSDADLRDQQWFKDAVTGDYNADSRDPELFMSERRFASQISKALEGDEASRKLLVSCMRWAKQQLNLREEEADKYFDNIEAAADSSKSLADSIKAAQSQFDKEVATKIGVPVSAYQPFLKCQFFPCDLEGSNLTKDGFFDIMSDKETVWTAMSNAPTMNGPLGKYLNKEKLQSKHLGGFQKHFYPVDGPSEVEPSIGPQSEAESDDYVSQ